MTDREFHLALGGTNQRRACCDRAVAVDAFDSRSPDAVLPSVRTLSLPRHSVEVGRKTAALFGRVRRVSERVRVVPSATGSFVYGPRRCSRCVFARSARLSSGSGRERASSVSGDRDSRNCRV